MAGQEAQSLLLTGATLGELLALTLDMLNDADESYQGSLQMQLLGFAQPLYRPFTIEEN